MTDTSTSTSATAGDSSAPPRPFSNILCAVDGTRRSFAAVEQGAALAGPDGHMTLLAVTAEGGSGMFQSAAISPQRAQRLLEEASAIADRAAVPHTTALDPGSPPQQVILDRAADHDLLALGAPWASWLGALLLDGVAESALGSFTVPTLAARALPKGASRFAERVLIASDGLDGSDELVALGTLLARSCDSRATLLHVAEGIESRSRPHRVEAQGERLFGALGDRGELRVEVGDADELIMQIARESSCSLIVMGRRRLGGLRGLGSVSRRVAHKASCSVLLLTPERLQG